MDPLPGVIAREINELQGRNSGVLGNSSRVRRDACRMLTIVTARLYQKAGFGYIIPQG